MVKHAHSSGEYNKRRAECEQAVRILSGFYPGIRALRNVTLDQIEQHRAALLDVVYRRAVHVVAENGRVLDAVKALRWGISRHLEGEWPNRTPAFAICLKSARPSWTAWWNLRKASPECTARV